LRARRRRQLTCSGDPSKFMQTHLFAKTAI
jgi:hypothetical protein